MQDYSAKFTNASGAAGGDSYQRYIVAGRLQDAFSALRPGVKHLAPGPSRAAAPNVKIRATPFKNGVLNREERVAEQRRRDAEQKHRKEFGTVVDSFKNLRLSDQDLATANPTRGPSAVQRSSEGDTTPTSGRLGPSSATGAGDMEVRQRAIANQRSKRSGHIIPESRAARAGSSVSSKRHRDSKSRSGGTRRTATARAPLRR